MHTCKYFSRVDTQKCHCGVIGYEHFLFLCPFKILIDSSKFPSKVEIQIYSLSAEHENSPHSHLFFFFPNLMGKQWLLVCSLAIFWWRASSALFFYFLAQQGLVLARAAQWVQVKDLYHVQSGSPGTTRVRFSCLCCNNSGNLMNLPGSKSSVVIKGDSA